MELLNKQKDKKQLMKDNLLDFDEYVKLKSKVIELSYYLDIEYKNMPRKKISKKIRSTCNELKVDSKFQPVFVSNLFIPDDREIITLIEEAINFGCRIEDVPSYIEINHGILKDLVELKLAELDIYKEFYHVQTKEKIEKVFQKVA